MNYKICDGWGELDKQKQEELSIPFFMTKNYHDFCAEVIEREEQAERQRVINHKRRAAELRRRRNAEQTAAVYFIIFALLIIAGNII